MMRLAFVALLVAACGSDATTNAPSGGTSSTSSSSGAGSSSSSGDTTCADCGQCGIAGPVNATAMFLTNVGVDASGRAAVNINLAKEGECRGENERPSTVHVASDQSGIEVTVGSEMLDRTKVDTKGASYVWNDRDLSLDVATGSSELNLTFKSAGAVLFSVKCLPVGESGSCTKE